MSNRMCLHTGSDTGADAVQHSKGFLLCFFSFARKKRAFSAHGAKKRRKKITAAAVLFCFSLVYFTFIVSTRT